MVLSERIEERSGSEPRAETLRSRGRLRLWLALGVPPVAWFAALNLAYFFVAWACMRENGELVLHAITLGGLAASAAAGVAAWGMLTDVEPKGQDDHDDRPSRTRFLSRLGLAGAIVFSLILVVQWLAILILEPCMPMPRSRFSPDALHVPAARATDDYARAGALLYDGVRLVSSAASTSNAPIATCGSQIDPVKSRSQGDAASRTPLAASSARWTGIGSRLITPAS